MSRAERAWLGTVPRLRHERHYGDRIVRCFVERPKNAYDLLREAVARKGAGEAIVCGNERLTYHELESAVEQCAAGLQKAGIDKGDRVAMLLGNGIPFPIVLFAVLRIGAIAVPMSVREQTQGLAYMLTHSGAKLLVSDADLADRLPRPEDTPAILQRIAVDPTAPFGTMRLLVPATGRPPAVVDEEDTAIILYTSGTTGRPKGAMLSHLGICHSALHYECCMALTSNDRSIVAVPMSHVTGVIALIAAMVRAAAALIIMPAFKAGEFLELASRERMTHSLMVPAMYNLCLLDPTFQPVRYSAWRVGAYGGAPMAPSTIAGFAQMLPRLSLMNAYGSTETTSPVTMMPPSETCTRPDSVGCAVPCADILVMDDDGREAALGEQGELWLGPAPSFSRSEASTHMVAQAGARDDSANERGAFSGGSGAQPGCQAQRRGKLIIRQNSASFSPALIRLPAVTRSAIITNMASAAALIISSPLTVHARTSPRANGTPSAAKWVSRSLDTRRRFMALHPKKLRKSWVGEAF